MTFSILRPLPAFQEKSEFLPASVVFDYPTVYSLTDYLATVLPELVETAAEQPAVVDDAYDDFTEAELLEQLSERLKGTQ